MTVWSVRGVECSRRRPGVMAILNVTPDSFSDGGRFSSGAPGEFIADAATFADAARAAMEEGARILDVGAESTRPGSTETPPDVEWARLGPCIAALAPMRRAGVLVSVDTRHAQVAQRALQAGADLINDVSGLADPAMADVVAAAGAGLVIGHMRGVPATMQASIHFEHLLDEIARELGRSVDRACAAGVPREGLAVDPCLGFGKTGPQSAALVVCAAQLEARLGRPVLIGASRKRFLADATGRIEPSSRDVASVVAATLAIAHGAAAVRVHAVRETVEALAVIEAVRAGAQAWAADAIQGAWAGPAASGAASREPL